MRIELSIATSYVPNWGVWHGVREIIQNCLDGKDGTWKYHHRQLSVINPDTVLDTSILLIGKTNKADDQNAIGQFGEGLKLGILALLREGIQIVIHNGNENWVPSLGESRQFPGEQVLIINTRKTKRTSEDFEVLLGISEEQWNEYKLRFINKPMEYTTEVLKDAPGKVYAKGIWICDRQDLTYGYNFYNLTVNRDRDMPGDWDLGYDAARALCAAELWDEIYDEIVTKDCLERKYLHYHMRDDGANALKDRFLLQHGEEAFPVRTVSEVSKAEYINKKGVLVNEYMHQLLEKPMGTFDTLWETAMRTKYEEIPFEELTHQQQIIYEQVLIITKKYSRPFSVAKFPRETTLGAFQEGKILVGITQMDKLEDAVETYVHELAHISGGDMTVSHELTMEKIYADLCVHWYCAARHKTLGLT